MSVINKVLKDLDKQKSATAQNSGSAAEANTTSSAETGFVKPEVQFTSQVQSGSSDERSRKGIYISIAMLIAVVLFAVMFYRQGLQLKKLQPLAETKQAQTVNVEPIDTNAAQTSNTDISLANNAQPLQLEANAAKPEVATFSDSDSHSNNSSDSDSISDSISDAMGHEASKIVTTDKPSTIHSERTQASEIDGEALIAAEPKAQSQSQVVIVDSKMDSGSVQVDGFSQNTSKVSNRSI